MLLFSFTSSDFEYQTDTPFRPPTPPRLEENTTDSDKDNNDNDNGIQVSADVNPDIHSNVKVENVNSLEAKLPSASTSTNSNSEDIAGVPEFKKPDLYTLNPLCIPTNLLPIKPKVNYI